METTEIWIELWLLEVGKIESLHFQGSGLSDQQPRDIRSSNLSGGREWR